GAQVSDLGVLSLRYIPDDAFIVRFDTVRLADVRALPFVRWVGEYQPEYKVAAALKQLAAAGKTMDIGLALAPGATPRERLLIRRAMQRVEREAGWGFGELSHV